MRFLFTLFFFFAGFVLFAQTGTIKIKKPDTLRVTSTPVVPPTTVRIPLLWFGYEYLRGINHSGQVFWPRNIDDSKLSLIKGWGLTVVYHKEIPFGAKAGGMDIYARSGISFLKTHAENKSLGIPFVAGLRLNPFSFPLGIQAEIGGRNFLPQGDPAFAGKIFLETGFGINLDLMWRHQFRAICIPVIMLNYKKIGPHQFAYLHVDLPLVQYRKKVRPVMTDPGPMDRM
ncbi:MAG: hypothetical protein FD123_3031 [Bacteroidetes bacterium]|nr:MAG: hypothetical protein FD123_3031 [Bacteroidota bacterium]